MLKNSVSPSVIKRLPRYYRFLGELDAQNVTRISSRELSEKMGITASQIRQDLNCFGGFGQQGYGYNVKALQIEIGRILGLNSSRKTILIGAGNLGKAIAAHINFKLRGFELIGIFDKDPAVCGLDLSGIKVTNIDELEEFCKKNSPVAAILCIPKTASQEIANKLISYGIKGFWNFSHYDLRLDYEDIVVENVHLGDSLMVLSYGLHNILNEE
ncbi:MAG: redox-sensing transcriptional repressor Rex [Clostridiales bacterium]|nr:redox-sensing transcriptional repressor Rex [Clostridiales bacterium]